MKEVSVLCLTYGPLGVLLRAAAARLKEVPVRITTIDGLSETMVGQIEEAIFRGADVIVAGGSNAAFAKRSFDVPVVQIRVSAYDYAQAIGQAKRLGSRIAIVTVEGERSPDFAAMSALLGVEVTVVAYSTGEDLEGVIRACGADVVIGAGHAVQTAEQMGLGGVLIYPGEETVAEAILEANKLVKEMWREKERSELTNTLIRMTPNAIVIINDQGEIMEFNAEAEKAYGKSALSVKGRRAAEVLGDGGLEALLTRDGDPDSAIRTIGERMYLQKHIQITQENRVTGAIEVLAELSDIRHAEYRYNLEQEKKNQVKGFHAKTRFSDIVGHSKALLETVEEAKFFARTDASILVLGETGTGKELFAQSIHNQSERRKGPFVAINCAAFPEALLESELFGYEEGAFTGSKKGGKMGIFELAGGGTIFLDEIGEIGLPLQARLLRVLQEKEVMRLGGERMYKIDVRVVTATNKDINHMGEREFRRDLLYRLKVLELHLPPLRCRGEDVAELFLHFLAQRLSLAEYGADLPREVLSLLKAYSWPGNVRELQNVCERFAIYLSHGARPSLRLLRRNMVRSIGEERFVEDIFRQYDYDPARRGESPETMHKLARRLKECLDYSNDQVAAALGVSRTTLWRMEK